MAREVASSVNGIIEDTNLSLGEHSITCVYKAGVKFLINEQISFMVFQNPLNDWNFQAVAFMLFSFISCENLFKLVSSSFMPFGMSLVILLCLCPPK